MSFPVNNTRNLDFQFVCGAKKVRMVELTVIKLSYTCISGELREKLLPKGLVRPRPVRAL